MLAAMLGLSYRDSLFKSTWRDRYVITAVSLRLRVGDAAAPRHPEIAEIVRGSSSRAHVVVRDAVLAVRRRKSMVYDAADPNHGSFFTNPLFLQPWRRPCVQALAMGWRCIPRGQG